MNLDEVIAKLQEMKASGVAGNSKVYVRCQFADIDGWLSGDRFKAQPVAGPPDVTVVVIEGGFGA